MDKPEKQRGEPTQWRQFGMKFNGRYFRLDVMLEAPLPLLIATVVFVTIVVVASFIITY